MCGRFALGVPKTLVEEAFAVDAGAYRPRYNIAPGQDALVVLFEGSGRCASFFRWGLVPSRTGDPAAGRRMINARSETVFDKPMFRASAKSRPCLVPAQFFYEWRKDSDGGKTPFAIRPEGAEVFAMAGFWEAWDREGQGPLRTFAVLTMEAGQQAASVHHRMPVMLGPEACAEWLDVRADRRGALARAMLACAAMRLELRRAGRAVNNPANDHPGVLDPGPRQGKLPV